MGSLPGQRHGLKLRQRGCVVERRGIPRQQQVDTLVQQVARVAGSDEKPNGRQIVSGDGDHRRRSGTGVSTLWRDPAGSRSERPRRTGDAPGDGQIGMSERQRRVHAWTPQRDRKRPVADRGDRLDETAHVRPQLVADAVAGPARPHVSRRDRRAVGETGVLPQRDDPGAAVGIEPPGRCQARTGHVPCSRLGPASRRADGTAIARSRSTGAVRSMDRCGRRARRSRSVRPVQRSARNRETFLPEAWCASCRPNASPERRR